jgi:hypothetical protein
MSHIYQNQQFAVQASLVASVTCRPGCVPGIWQWNQNAGENYARSRLKEEMLRQLSDAEAQQKDSDSKQIYDEFSKQANVTDWPAADDLQANPFIYRGKIIGLAGTFQSMLTENVADFAFGRNHAYVSGIPLAKFQHGGTNILLAAKMIGRQDSFPYLEFKDAYFCKTSDCEDALFWKKEAATDRFHYGTKPFLDSTRRAPQCFSTVKSPFVHLLRNTATIMLAEEH